MESLVMTEWVLITTCNHSLLARIMSLELLMLQGFTPVYWQTLVLHGNAPRKRILVWKLSFLKENWVLTLPTGHKKEITFFTPVLYLFQQHLASPDFHMKTLERSRVMAMN